MKKITYISILIALLLSIYAGDDLVKKYYNKRQIDIKLAAKVDTLAGRLDSLHVKHGARFDSTITVQLVYGDSIRILYGVRFDSSLTVQTVIGDSARFSKAVVFDSTLHVQGIAAHNLLGNITPEDSSKSLFLLDSDGIKWFLKINTEGVLVPDSTGYN